MFYKNILLVLLLSFFSYLHALTLKQSVQLALDTNPEIMAERSNQEAYKRYVDDKQSGYYPRVDLSAYLEGSEIYDDSHDGTKEGSSDKQGYRADLKLEQMLYDGGLTPAEVEKAKKQRDANRFKTNQNIETIVLNVVDAYDGLVQYRELLRLTEDIIQTNEENLLVAKEKEDISGEVLETYQVSSKLNLVTEQYLEEQITQREQKNALIRYLGVEEITGYVCRPTMDPTLIPDTVQKAIEIAIRQNFTILEQMEKIKERYEDIAIADAAFLPTLTFELQGSFDDDLALPENGIETDVIARLNLNWNLYYGGKTQNESEQQKIFLKEAKEDLEALTREVAQSTKNLYFEYEKNKQRIDILKRYVDANDNIVKVYKEEFASGTRTFVDILDAETELYESKQSLVAREMALLDNYYNLLYTFSRLSRAILDMRDAECKAPVIEKKEGVKNELDEDLVELFDESSLDENKVNKDTIQENLEEELSDADQVLLEQSLNEEIKEEVPMFFKDKVYTLNMATWETSKSADIFADGLLNKEEAFVYKIFNDNRIYNKVLYQRFDSYKQALAAYKALDKKIITTHQPFIDKLEKHKQLYMKYIEYNK